MIETLWDYQLEISLILIALNIFFSLKKEKSEGSIVLASIALAIIATSIVIWKSSGREIFSAGMAFVVTLYAIFFGWSLITLKSYYKILSKINTDILLFLGVLFAWEYTKSPFISAALIWVVIFYIVITSSLNHVGKNNRKGLSATTHTLKKGYLLNIEEVDKELSLVIITFITIALSIWNWMTGQSMQTEFPAYQQLFNYQLIVFILAVLMLIFSYIKFSLKRDELTKKEDKRVKLASRGRYGEYYGCNNTLIWISRRESIRKLLIEDGLFGENKNLDNYDFFVEDIKPLFSKDTKGNDKEWDYLCQLASAYYSHAIALNKYSDIEKIKSKDDQLQYAGYLLRAFNIYKQLPEIDEYFSSEYYHYIDVCSDMHSLFYLFKNKGSFSKHIKDLKDNTKSENVKNFNKVTYQLGEEFDIEDGDLVKVLELSVNHQFNKVLRGLKERGKGNSITNSVTDWISKLENILKGRMDSKSLDKYQVNAASSHTKTIELLSALKNAHNPQKLEIWIDNTLKYATGHVGKNVSKFYAQRFDAPANLFITITGLFFSVVALLSVLEIFNYSNVVNIEIFALSGSALGVILAFIFKSTIESFFAALQMYLSDMLRVGDRIKCEALGVDGHVSGFGFSSIDFQNLDNSHIKIPAADLIKQTLSNLRNLPNTGRRIEIKLTFSINSIKRYKSNDIVKLKKNLGDMSKYLECKLKSLSEANCMGKEGNSIKCYEEEIDKDDSYPQKRFLTNLGSFRSYAEQYLFEHQWLNDNLSPMVVVSDTGSNGVTVLITAYSQPDDRFVRTKAFMNLQSDILEHLITTSRYFDLKLHQSVSESKAQRQVKVIEEIL